MAEKKKSAPVSTGPVKPEDKKKALETALAQIEKNFGKGAIMRLGDDIPVNVEAISTGLPVARPRARHRRRAPRPHRRDLWARVVR